MAALDLYQPHYQVTLITYLKFTKNNAKDARKEEKSNQDAILLGKIYAKLKWNYKCKECKKRWLNPVNGSIYKFPNIHQFCNRDIIRFVLLLRNGVYPHKYMDQWDSFDEIPLPDKKLFTAYCI